MNGTLENETLENETKLDFKVHTPTPLRELPHRRNSVHSRKREGKEGSANPMRLETWSRGPHHH